MIGIANGFSKVSLAALFMRHIMLQQMISTGRVVLAWARVQEVQIWVLQGVMVVIMWFILLSVDMTIVRLTIGPKTIPDEG